MEKGSRDISSGGQEIPSTTTSLIDGIKAKDEEAWERVIRVYTPLVYSWCRRKQVSKSDAPDIVQAVFQSVLKSILAFQYGPGSTFRGWLRTITNRRIADYWAKINKEPQARGGSSFLADLAQHPAPDEDESINADENARILLQVLELVRDEFEQTSWTAFQLILLKQQSPRDVAEELGISLNAVYVAKSRILRRLREHLEQLGW